MATVFLLRHLAQCRQVARDLSALRSLLQRRVRRRVQDVELAKEPSHQLSQQASARGHEGCRGQVVQLGIQALPEQRLGGHRCGATAEIRGPLRQTREDLLHKGVSSARSRPQDIELRACTAPRQSCILQAQDRCSEAVIGVGEVHRGRVLAQHRLSRIEASPEGNGLGQALASLPQQRLLLKSPQLLRLLPEACLRIRHCSCSCLCNGRLVLMNEIALKHLELLLGGRIASLGDTA
mmetsp:Transcript_20215/g.45679  ORF Transcript_20215/g.45679 Transcript_20215/m.45679 type:complete len:237 (-) Transcript_20215:475-1185(-)